jgi:hypothetical protein
VTTPSTTPPDPATGPTRREKTYRQLFEEAVDRMWADLERDCPELGAVLVVPFFPDEPARGSFVLRERPGTLNHPQNALRVVSEVYAVFERMLLFCRTEITELIKLAQAGLAGKAAGGQDQA